jgi:aminoglycoside phosphotransferase (APT) family kinase protein
MRLRHGYTNGTATDGRAVTKEYLGPDAGQRRANEIAVLDAVGGLLPVPPLLDRPPGAIVTGFVQGTHGQELLAAGHAREVLGVCGRLARRVHAVDPALVPGLGTPKAGEVLVHGDFGPQNLLIDAERWEPAALLDWELAGFGDPLHDLAWAEWIVRFHHAELVGEVGALYDGYGWTPPWVDRHAAMVRACERLLAFVRRWSPEAVAMWEDRTRRTEAFTA